MPIVCRPRWPTDTCPAGSALGEAGHLQQDVRLPFLLLSAHSSDPDELAPAGPNRLKDWLVETLRHLEGTPGEYGEESFMGELPGVGMMIALGRLVSKGELGPDPELLPNDHQPDLVHQRPGEAGGLGA